MYALKFGLQLYTIRQETAHDFAGALRRVAAAGFQGVELAGYGGLSAQQLNTMLEALGLEVIGSHVGFGRLTTALQEEIAFNKAIGSKYITCPYIEANRLQNEQDWRETFRLLHEAGEACAANGIGFAYHNHMFECVQRIGKQTALDALFDTVPASAVKVELDTAWLHAAGLDPIPYMSKYQGRLPLVHFKDLRKTASGSWQTVELGAGELNLRRIADAAEMAGAEWLIYEQDHCQHSPFAAMKASVDWVVDNNIF